MVDDLQKDRQIAYTTVLTVMDNPYRKGWLRRTGTGRAVVALALGRSSRPDASTRYDASAGLTQAPV
jgi:predicted transcriptional regulator